MWTSRVPFVLDLTIPLGLPPQMALQSSITTLSRTQQTKPVLVADSAFGGEAAAVYADQFGMVGTFADVVGQKHHLASLMAYGLAQGQYRLVYRMLSDHVMMLFFVGHGDKSFCSASTAFLPPGTERSTDPTATADRPRRALPGYESMSLAEAQTFANMRRDTLVEWYVQAQEDANIATLGPTPADVAAALTGYTVEAITRRKGPAAKKKAKRKHDDENSSLDGSIDDKSQVPTSAAESGGEDGASARVAELMAQKLDNLRSIAHEHGFARTGNKIALAQKIASAEQLAADNGLAKLESDIVTAFGEPRNGDLHTVQPSGHYRSHMNYVDRFNKLFYAIFPTYRAQSVAALYVHAVVAVLLVNAFALHEEHRGAGYAEATTDDGVIANLHKFLDHVFAARYVDS